MEEIKKTKKEFHRWTIGRILISVVLFTVLLMSGIWFGKTGKEQKLQLLRQSVKRIIVECYAIEGEYPVDVAYLEENYGLKYDHKKYYIHYDYMASNMMPVFEVYEKE